MSNIKTNIRLLVLLMSLIAMEVITAEEEIVEAEIKEAEEVKEYIQDLVKDFSLIPKSFENAYI